MWELTSPPASPPTNHDSCEWWKELLFGCHVKLETLSTNQWAYYLAFWLSVLLLVVYLLVIMYFLCCTSMEEDPKAPPPTWSQRIAHAALPAQFTKSTSNSVEVDRRNAHGCCSFCCVTLPLLRVQEHKYHKACTDEPCHKQEQTTVAPKSADEKGQNIVINVYNSGQKQAKDMLARAVHTDPASSSFAK